MNYVYSILLFLIFFPPPEEFKVLQLKNPRVMNAYSEKEDLLRSILKKNEIKRESLEILIRVFKKEQIVELWGKNRDSARFVHLKNYDICASSGSLGPKRKQGDCQVPEGFYVVNMFNPASNFFLSLGINYPNMSDRILSPHKNLGGSIFIHGDCVTIGCIPLTDDKIKEVYIFAVEAKTNGQDKIQVHIYPGRLTNTKFNELKDAFKSDVKLITFWNNLKEGFDCFENSRALPEVSVLKNGTYKYK